MTLHPAESRGYRELYAFARNISGHWSALADRLAGTSAEPPLAEQLRRRAFCSDQRAALMPLERSARAAAIELGSAPDEAIKPLDDSPAGRTAHGAAYAIGTLGEWLDRRASGR